MLKCKNKIGISSVNLVNPLREGQRATPLRSGHLTSIRDSGLSFSDAKSRSLWGVGREPFFAELAFVWDPAQ